MNKKVSILVILTLICACFFSTNVKAQEGETQEPDVVVTSPDSLNNEILEDESKPNLDEEVEIPSNELPNSKPVIQTLTPKAAQASPVSEKVKPKEGKKEISFNLFYYLIYKFKHVDEEE